MPGEELPPQFRRSTALYAAGGGFAGALLAIIVARLLADPCCCTQARNTAPLKEATRSVATVRSDSEAAGVY